jgi:AcrR family transcriptional regulator
LTRTRSINPLTWPSHLFTTVLIIVFSISWARYLLMRVRGRRCRYPGELTLKVSSDILNAGGGHSLQTKNARGEDTRRKLLEAATKLFSEQGFHGASTRDIAGAARATLPSIEHHFGSKEGLYQAVLLEIAAEMREKLAPASERAFRVLAGKEASREQQLNALEDLVSANIRATLGGRPEWASLVVQAQQNGYSACTSVDDVLEKLLLIPSMQLIARLEGRARVNAHVRLQAFLLLGQVFIFRAVRSTALRLMNWPDINSERVEEIVSLLRTEIRLLFACHDG